MVIPQYYEGTRKIHLGKKITNMTDYEALYEKEDDDLSSVLKSQIEKIMDSQYYMAVVEKMRMATELLVPDIANTMEAQKHIRPILPPRPKPLIKVKNGEYICTRRWDLWE